MKRKDSEILRFLIEKSGEKVNIRELSREMKIDYKTAYNVVKRLNKEGLIPLDKFGKAVICSLNKKVHPLIFQAEFERRENLLRNRNLGVLYEKMKSLSFPFIALIFGSCARGRPAKDSDIDLMVICEKSREKEVEEAVSLLPLNIHLTALTPEEFLSMAKSREFSVVSEAMKNNAILVGIEDYYRLVENVG